MQIDSIEFGCTKSKLEDYMTGSQEVVGSSPIFEVVHDEIKSDEDENLIHWFYTMNLMKNIYN